MKLHTLSLQILLVSVIMLASGLNRLYAQDSADYRIALKKMFEVSGSEEAYKSAIKQMFQMFKANGDVPEEMWSGLEQEFLKTSMDDLVDMLTPVYQKHLSRSDLDKVIEFYGTPAGARFAQKTPLIMEESMQVGQQWGLKIGQDFQNKLKEKGY